MMRGYWGHPGLWNVGHHWTGAGIAGLVLMIILWIALVVAIVLVIRALILHSRRNRLAAPAPGAVPPGGTYPPPVTPGPGAVPSNLLAILEERYAKGEITREDFLQRKQDLGLGGQAETPTPAAS
jgi:uncharacterized membrane protein